MFVIKIVSLILVYKSFLGEHGNERLGFFPVHIHVPNLKWLCRKIISINSAYLLTTRKQSKPPISVIFNTVKSKIMIG